MKPYSPSAARVAARRYAVRFPNGPELADRVRELLERYPTCDSWISWEGDTLTNADTPAKLRNLLAALTIERPTERAIADLGFPRIFR